MSKSREQRALNNLRLIERELRADFADLPNDVALRFRRRFVGYIGGDVTPSMEIEVAVSTPHCTDGTGGELQRNFISVQSRDKHWQKQARFTYQLIHITIAEARGVLFERAQRNPTTPE